jgi:hypothetical protein
MSKDLVEHLLAKAKEREKNRIAKCEASKRCYTKSPERVATRTAVARAWNKANPEKRYDIRLRHRYGPDADKHNAEQLQSQGGFCAICSKPQIGSKQDHNQDHDHKTGRLRGILCQRCNSMLGGLEDLNFRDKAEAYIKYWAETNGGL